MNCTTPIAMAATQHAQRQAERSGRFALAGAGVHDQEALLDGLARDLGVLHRLAFGHLGAMALGFVFIGFVMFITFLLPRAASPPP